MFINEQLRSGRINFPAVAVQIFIRFIKSDLIWLPENKFSATQQFLYVLSILVRVLQISFDPFSRPAFISCSACAYTCTFKRVTWANWDYAFANSQVRNEHYHFSLFPSLVMHLFIHCTLVHRKLLKTHFFLSIFADLENAEMTTWRKSSRTTIFATCWRTATRQR